MRKPDHPETVTAIRLAGRRQWIPARTIHDEGVHVITNMQNHWHKWSVILEVRTG